MALYFKALHSIIELDKFSVKELSEHSGIKPQTLYRIIKRFIKINLLMKLDGSEYRLTSVFRNHRILRTLFEVLRQLDEE